MQKAKIEYLRERVNSDKLEDAIKILRTEIPENDDVVSIGGRLNRMNAQTVRGIANSDELNNERNNIRESLILFLNKLSEKNVPPKPPWLKIIFKIVILKTKLV